MELSRAISRRAAIKDMGKAGLAIVVFGTACTSEGATTTLPGQTTSTLAGQTTSTAVATTGSGETTSTTPSGAGSEWARVNMGFVSAYILYRNGEAALVDTGQPGAEGDIEAALGLVDLGWDAVTSVILTHKHPDHAGSVLEVASLATNSNVYVGEGDLAAIGTIPLADGTQGPVSVSDNDKVFDLEIIETPGHTPGHISILDSSAGILVAGDAMNTVGGTLNSSDPQFTDNLAQAADSVRKLAGFDFEVVLFGHGEPILSGGSADVNGLATGLSG